ncbi:hypothetical protein, partial [Ralstonia pseudosolanacearum]|uniref:hypothetical protein n=2 Tax=Ralstonia pseudosolanacearum TaxID=1310165 RepID=UPI003CEEC7A0
LVTGSTSGIGRGGGRLGIVRVIVAGMRRWRGADSGVPRGRLIVAAATAAAGLRGLGMGVVVRGHRRGRMGCLPSFKTLKELQGQAPAPDVWQGARFARSGVGLQPAGGRGDRFRPLSPQPT